MPSNPSDTGPPEAGDPPPPTERGRHHGRPWRVEGMPEHHEDGDEEHRQPPHWKEIARRLWLPLLILLVVNWIVVTMLVSGNEAERTTVAYSFFHQQVTDDNVSEVTTTGDSITGSFDRPVRYPPKTTRTRR
jgi:hypothetical protein